VRGRAAASARLLDVLSEEGSFACFISGEPDRIGGRRYDSGFEDGVMGVFSKPTSLVLVGSEVFLGNFLVLGNVVDGLPKQEAMVLQKVIFAYSQGALKSK
jgi:hypothetical protein